MYVVICCNIVRVLERDTIHIIQPNYSQYCNSHGLYVLHKCFLYSSCCAQVHCSGMYVHAIIIIMLTSLHRYHHQSNFILDHIIDPQLYYNYSPSVARHIIYNIASMHRFDHHAVHRSIDSN